MSVCLFWRHRFFDEEIGCSAVNQCKQTLESVKGKLFQLLKEKKDYPGYVTALQAVNYYFKKEFYRTIEGSDKKNKAIIKRLAAYHITAKGERLTADEFKAELKIGLLLDLSIAQIGLGLS